jgi:hypothetical protein
MSNELINEGESTRGNNGTIVPIDDYAFIPDGKEETLSYSEQLNNMVKVNYHKLTLEKELLKAKAYFKNRTKNELLDLLFSMNQSLTKDMRKHMRNNTKTALITLVIKGWMKHKQKEIDTRKDLSEELVAAPETEQALDDAIQALGIAPIMSIDLGFFESSVDLPETPEWDGTTWSTELDQCIAQGYSTIQTPDGSQYEIIDRTKVLQIGPK